jgi:hypothetical protein
MIATHAHMRYCTAACAAALAAATVTAVKMSDSTHDLNALCCPVARRTDAVRAGILHWLEVQP